MSGFEGLVVGVLLIGIVMQVAAGDWGDALDGVVTLFLYVAWMTQKHRADRLDRELGLYRAFTNRVGAHLRNGGAL